MRQREIGLGRGASCTRQRQAWGGLALPLGALAAILSFAMLAPATAAARIIMGGGAAGPGMVSLPYMMQDASGNNYRIYQGGWFQQNNNMPLYSQGAQITIDGQNPNVNGNTAKLDAKSGDLIFENMSSQGCSVTRYIHVEKGSGYIRYIDVVKNTGKDVKTFQLMVQSTCNYGINTGENVADPKQKNQSIGWVGQTGANQSIVEMYAGKGVKTPPQIVWPQGNNVVQGTFALTIPPGKEQAVMHLHSTAPNQGVGTQFILELKEAPILKSLAPSLRRLITNFRSAQDFVGDLEILRGDTLDVVELRGGDSFKGTLNEPKFELDTFYGAITIPSEKAISIINIGQFRPRQLIVTSDGQIIGGHLKKQTIELQMSSGQVTQIPLTQMSRLGYHKRPGEAEDWTFEKPMVLLRTGERIIVQMPEEPIDVVTRYGKMSFTPAQVADVQLQNEDNAVHVIELTDGSRFAGLLTADAFHMKLDAGSGTQEVTFPLSTVARLQITSKIKEADDATAMVKLSNDDQMVGSLSGRLKLVTAFDTIEINAPELRSLTHASEGSAQDVTVSLWDGTTFSGQIEQQAITCALSAGLNVQLPVALVRDYTQPQPRPSAAMVEKIKKLVTEDLNNDDFHVRDRARTQLLGMGPTVVSIIKQVRDGQPPEVQKSIDLILGELDKSKKPAKEKAEPPPPAVDN